MIYKQSPSWLAHHGIDGQRWGVKHGPPYPLDNKISTGKRLKNKEMKASIKTKIKSGKKLNKEELKYYGEREIRKNGISSWSTILSIPISSMAAFGPIATVPSIWAATIAGIAQYSLGESAIRKNIEKYGTKKDADEVLKILNLKVSDIDKYKSNFNRQTQAARDLNQIAINSAQVANRLAIESHNMAVNSAAISTLGHPIV